MIWPDLTLSFFWLASQANPHQNVGNLEIIDKGPPGERRVGCVTYQVCFRVHVSVFEHVDSYDRMKCQNIKAGMF